MTHKYAAPGFPTLLQRFFCERLIKQRNASPLTVAAYRDTFRLLLTYLEADMNRSPSAITMEDLNAETIQAFLNHLEEARGNCVRSRNARFAAIRSFMAFAAFQDPASLPTIQRVLAIPMKHYERPVLGSLSRTEMQAILDAPDSMTWSGRRDRVLFATMYNTGARVSEMITIRVTDLTIGVSSSVRIHGKGRKKRVLPLWPKTARQLREWQKQLCDEPNPTLFPNAKGNPMTRSGIEYRLRMAVGSAAAACPTLKGRRISPHTIRHTTAMHLLQSGVDITVIALLLGHESLETTHKYLEADLTMKEKALSKVHEPRTGRLRYRPSDRLLQFLESL
ncbi:site-specific integrase [Candidatus Sumerlaeota bacterium]